MVTQNDYTLNLYNGDTGIIAPDPQQGDVLKAWFPAVKNTQSRAFRSFALSRLSSLETCFAITVHKSQGSEYDSIILLLPPVDSPVLTRELIYTGLTRSRGKVHIYGKESVFIKGIDKRIERWSGMKRRLYGG
jgi:exodeoxyribonuclease V alpha subunit